MNLTPENYAEICKQSAFISALVAGFSFAFLGSLLVSSVKSRIIDWVMIFSTLSVAGFLICSLAWTLSASRMALISGGGIINIPQLFINLHRFLSKMFIISFFFFLVTLGLSGWIRSAKLGIVTGLISLTASVIIVTILGKFIS
jgi:hypothetical protein